MLTRQKALGLIKNSSKYKHSLFVAEVMKILAGFFDCGKEEWELVGLLHDFDYDLVEDVSQHGIIAAEKLEGELSDQCLRAIKSHDFRTGLKPEGLLSEAIIFADSLSLVTEGCNMEESFSIENAIQKAAEARPWIKRNVTSFEKKYGVSLEKVLNRLRISLL